MLEVVKLYREDWNNMSSAERGLWLSRGAQIVDTREEANASFAEKPMSRRGDPVPGNSLSRENFDRLPPTARMQHMRSGGTVHD